MLKCALTHSFSNPSKQIPLLMKNYLQASLAKMAKRNLHGKTSIPPYNEPFELSMLFLLTSPLCPPANLIIWETERARSWQQNSIARTQSAALGLIDRGSRCNDAKTQSIPATLSVSEPTMKTKKKKHEEEETLWSSPNPQTFLSPQKNLWCAKGTVYEGGDTTIESWPSTWNHNPRPHALQMTKERPNSLKPMRGLIALRPLHRRLLRPTEEVAPRTPRHCEAAPTNRKLEGEFLADLHWFACLHQGYHEFLQFCHPFVSFLLIGASVIICLLLSAGISSSRRHFRAMLEFPTWLRSRHA